MTHPSQSKLYSIVMETLDPRRMLSASLDDAGLLTITGTPKSDRIVLSVNPEDQSKLLVRVNKTVTSFDKSDVKSINISAEAGNDRVIMDETEGKISARATVSGGTGNDRISTGSWNDSIDGGAGNDRIVSGDGNDDVRGRRGNDRIDGGAGEDELDGDEGNDRIHGGDDDDVLNGDSGNDHLWGDAGNDDAFGGSGKDFLAGGEGDDDLYGGKEDDSLAGESGNDALDGGADSDSLVGGTGDDMFHNRDERKDPEKRDQRRLMLLESLPAEVKSAFTTSYAGAMILKVEKETEDEGEEYEIKFLLNGRVHEAEYSSAGELISHEVRGEPEHD